MEAALELETIKWLLVAILVGMFIVVISSIVVAYAAWLLANQAREQHSGVIFKTVAEEHLGKNELDSLVEHIEDRLGTFPYDVWAHWYMGQAKYFKGELLESKRSFERVVELEPGWSTSVESWLEKIEEKLGEGPTLVQ